VVRIGVGFGDGEDDVQISSRGVAHHPLPAREHPLVPVAFRAGGELARIGAGALLGHRERREDPPVEQRVEPAPLLLLGAGERDELGVAGVGGLAAEDERRELTATEDLVEQAELELAEAPAPELRVEMRRPQAALLHALLQGRGEPAEGPVVEVEHLERVDLLLQEAARPVELGRELRLGREVPGHPSPLVTSLAGR
jgi:hypothetical protein